MISRNKHTNTRNIMPLVTSCTWYFYYEFLVLRGFCDCNFAFENCLLGYHELGSPKLYATSCTAQIYVPLLAIIQRRDMLLIISADYEL